MRLKAYVLAADPAWIEASVLSYYDLVEEILVSYDKDGLGWTGVPIPVEECLRRLKAIDRDGKMRYAPGHYARLDHRPMENETYQRQCAIDAIGDTCDWVLQLDTDEVLASPDVFLDCLRQAEEAGRTAIEFPSRYLHCRVRGPLFLEWCARFWLISPGYPGPYAVRPGTRLVFARQTATPSLRVGYQLAPLVKRKGLNAEVDRRIAPRDAAVHFSWIRSEEWMRWKSRSSGHARDFDWDIPLQRWLRAKRRPYFALLWSNLQRGPYARPLRLLRLTPEACRLAQLSPEWEEESVNQHAAEPKEIVL